MPEIRPVPQATWQPLTDDGCVNVECVVLMGEPLVIALLKFDPNGTIHEHAVPWDIDVVCMEGSGMTSVDGEEAPINAGQSVRWPANAMHRLWTTDSPMVTLMAEHYGPAK